eukprot:TRINITY_DN99982_c0_g1_i1.p1 TRINITY_DN99982_c0_g1~~TRINITY_DN99982_c0_g1_i1.p1  ORF type:complete len:250 (+),score=46.70 TRINITY_DN99982_c0_g1_i1:67-816(+)
MVQRWRLALSTLLFARTAAQDYPGCVENGVVLRHAGAHAIFVDLSAYGTSGCWSNDCSKSDKFNSRDPGVCARACSLIPECTHWSFGEQDDTTKCFVRKSDGGREEVQGFISGSKGCSPPSLPDAWLAMQVVEMPALQACDAGKSEACPDMARAMTTWRFAIAALLRAAVGALDSDTMLYVKQISSDTDAFATQMSEENFPVVIGNNRQVFIALKGWLDGQPKADVSPDDPSLPAPLRGELCGASSCYE